MKLKHLPEFEYIGNCRLCYRSAESPDIRDCWSDTRWCPRKHWWAGRGWIQICSHIGSRPACSCKSGWRHKLLYPSCTRQYLKSVHPLKWLLNDFRSESLLTDTLILVNLISISALETQDISVPAKSDKKVWTRGELTTHSANIIKVNLHHLWGDEKFIEQSFDFSLAEWAVCSIWISRIYARGRELTSQRYPQSEWRITFPTFAFEGECTRTIQSCWYTCSHRHRSPDPIDTR